MEGRIALKVDAYISAFRLDMETQIEEGLAGDDLIEYMNTYHLFSFSDEDFKKRKRSKNMVPLCDRCMASRIDKAQCSRRKQTDQIFCGTHIKGQPYGVIQSEDIVDPIGAPRTQNVWCEDVNGIYYYIDDIGNVYSPEDIVANKPNPKVITKYVKTGDTYTIPTLFER